VGGVYFSTIKHLCKGQAKKQGCKGYNLLMGRCKAAIKNTGVSSFIAALHVRLRRVSRAVGCGAI